MKDNDETNSADGKKNAKNPKSKLNVAADAAENVQNKPVQQQQRKQETRVFILQPDDNEYYRVDIYMPLKDTCKGFDVTRIGSKKYLKVTSEYENKVYAGRVVKNDFEGSKASKKIIYTYRYP